VEAGPNGVPALRGCVSQGDSRENALENVREAIAVYIEDCRESGEAVPTEIGREIVEVETPLRKTGSEN
jgi:predicted RNase H-like HicB family nuclease